ncbi:MAG: dTDP-4-amino-4,6-dideoxygalactose transaminase [Pseudomonadales bacterium]|nr:dTDP-4-amino-4,6-dideoxygalactose transaminase [Pseudomonadales bacterium]MDG1443377.1 dTDP-4-amino-4,6-dideoxygalactose transaminase [Pseudomonadales bacterium]
MTIRYTQPRLTGNEEKYIAKVLASGRLAGNGEYTRQCQELLEKETGYAKALLTNSCTAALEMAAILIDVKQGDEVIMPSFTFVSTANAFVLRGAIPVFVDVESGTFNIDPAMVASAITPKTKAIVAVNYAGIPCNMRVLSQLAKKHGLYLIEDAAQSYLSEPRNPEDRNLADFSALSFHETKNIVAGEGGALLVNSSSFIERAEIIWEKGTNRTKFSRGEVEKYSWVDIGSSFLPSEITAAFLLAQLEGAKEITADRILMWNEYHASCLPLQSKGHVQLPRIPESIFQNAHLYFVLAKNLDERADLLKHLNDDGVSAVHHYVPLHDSPAGLRFGRAFDALPNTDKVADTIVRLPLWSGMDIRDVKTVVSSLNSFYGELNE